MQSSTTVRIGTPADIPHVEAIAHRALSSSDRVSIPGRQYLLVLDAPDGGLAAAAHLSMDREGAHLDLLAVAARYVDEHLERRMIGVAEALCGAFGCRSLDVTSRHAA